VRHDDGGLARLVGFFAMMLGVGLILDAEAVALGGTVLLAAAAVFGYGLWFGHRSARRGDEDPRRKGVR